MLCPSFFQADIIQNPNVIDRFAHKMRTAVIGMLQGKSDAPEAAPEQDNQADIKVAAE